jgi:hypothetical protein
VVDGLDDGEGDRMAGKRALSNRGGRWIVLFDSTHDVMAAERALRAARLPHDLIPVPKELSADCGMAIELREADAPSALPRLEGSALRWREIFKRDRGGFEPVARTGRDGRTR